MDVEKGKVHIDFPQKYLKCIETLESLSENTNFSLALQSKVLIVTK